MITSKPSLRSGFDCIIRPEPSGASQTTPAQPRSLSPKYRQFTSMVMECKDPAIIYIGYHGSSCRGDARSRGIIRYDVGLVNRKYSGSVISRVNIRHYGPGKSQHICLLEGTVYLLEKKHSCMLQLIVKRMSVNHVLWLYHINCIEKWSIKMIFT